MLRGHRHHYEELQGGWYRIFFGIWVYLEHVVAVAEAHAVKVLAATWLFFPLVGLYYFAIAYYGVMLQTKLIVGK